MNLEDINKQYLLKKDLYDAVLTGISSKVLRYQNGIFSIRLIIGVKWKKSEALAAREAAFAWRDYIPEFKDALACKVYIVDLRKEESSIPSLSPGRSFGRYTARKGILFGSGKLN